MLPFAVPPKAGAEFIRSRELYVEAPPDLSSPDGQVALALADRVTSAHAPWEFPAGTGPAPTDGRVRLHIASTERELREPSLGMVSAYIRRARAAFPNLKLIVAHAAPRNFPHPPIRPRAGEIFPPLRPELASWELLVEAVGGLARLCGELGLVLALENNWAYWDGIAPERPVEELQPGDFLEYFCSSPEEWRRLCRAVRERALALCLDPSHAAPYCHRWRDPDLRRAALQRYLAETELIGHIHWNDSDLFAERGREDLHLPAGQGNLGDEFHAALKRRAEELGHPACLEHFHGAEAFERERAYIAGL